VIYCQSHSRRTGVADCVCTRSKPRYVRKECDNRGEGGCTLKRGHKGPHEGWGLVHLRFVWSRKEGRTK
jgi:hypothetical protein